MNPTQESGNYSGLKPGSGFRNICQRQWYGVEIDESNSSPDLTRIASDMTLHASLPVHSRIRACLLRDNGTVNYYLDAVDWTKKENGEASALDGTHGNVMIEVPEFWLRQDRVYAGALNKWQLMISPYFIQGWQYIPKFYVGAFEAAVNRTAPIKLWSVINAATEYRGGNNTAAWDAAANTLLGKPATSISLTNFRTYARNKEAGAYKWNLITYRHSMLVYLLYIIEYATLNSQKAVNSSLTSVGYKQGGLGNGVTTVDDTTWNTFSSYNPVIPCGTSNSLGSGSGQVDYTIPSFGHASGAVKVNRYRGIENPFGHIWKWNDGVSIYHQTDGAGGLSKFFMCDNPIYFADGTEANYSYKGNLPRTAGYLKYVTFDDKAIFIPSIIGGNSATYFCDYFYTPGGTGAWVALLCGGAAINGSAAGFAYLYSNAAASDASADFGARLCYIP